MSAAAVNSAYLKTWKKLRTEPQKAAKNVSYQDFRPAYDFLQIHEKVTPA